MAGHGGARPGAGRPKGSKNKRALEFADKFDEECVKQEFDLIRSLVTMCKDDDKEIALKAQQTILPYRFPKLRQVEVTADTSEYQPVFKLIVESEKEEKK